MATSSSLTIGSTQPMIRQEPESPSDSGSWLAHRMRTVRRWSAFLVILLLMLGVVMSWLINEAANDRIVAEKQLEHDKQCTDLTLRMQEAIRLDRLLLSSLAVSASWVNGSVTLDLFSSAVSSLMFDDDGEALGASLGYGWVPHLRESQLASYQAYIQTVFPDLVIIEYNATGHIVPAHGRDNYFPVIFIEPMSGNEAAHGFDLGSNPVRRKALETARDTNAPIVSGRIVLVQTPGLGPGFSVLMLHPVYDPTAPLSTLEERRSALIGLISVALYLPKVVQITMPTPVAKLTLFDETDGVLMYSSESEISPDLLLHEYVTPEPNRRSIAAVRGRVEVADRHWHVICEAWDPNVRAEYSLLLLGTLISVMVCIMTFVTLARSLSLSSMVADRTTQLQQTNALLEDRVDLHDRLKVNLDEESSKNRLLLYSLMPKSMCERIRRTNNAVERFDDVTVIFVHIVGFSQYSATMAPARLVAMLSDIFEIVDAQLVPQRVEKIKIAGDTYMAVAGIPVASQSHMLAAAWFALSVQAAVEFWSRGVGRNIKLRIGMASGSVVAGVIGNSRLQFDAWGPVVDVARRMEILCPPGRIQMAESTYSQLHEASKGGSFGLVAVPSDVAPEPILSPSISSLTESGDCDTNESYYLEDLTVDDVRVGDGISVEVVNTIGKNKTSDVVPAWLSAIPSDPAGENRSSGQSSAPPPAQNSSAPDVAISMASSAELPAARRNAAAAAAAASTNGDSVTSHSPEGSVCVTNTGPNPLAKHVHTSGITVTLDTATARVRHNDSVPSTIPPSPAYRGEVMSDVGVEESSMRANNGDGLDTPRSS